MRARGFVPALVRAGFDVEVWAGGSALDAMADLDAIVPIETVAPGRALVPRTIARVRADRARFADRRPSLLVSDGDAPSTYAAASLGIPIVAVGHGLVFAYADVGEVPVHWLAREAMNALSSSALSSRQVAVHFANARPRFRSTTIARMEVRAELDRGIAPCGEVVAYFRDGGGDAWLAALADRGLRVRSFTNAATAPRGVTRESPSLERFAHALTRASGVVGTAGSNLVAECRFLGIPLLALPADDDIEQKLNARIGASDSAFGPLIEGRLGTPDDTEIDSFVSSVRKVGSDGRLPDGLPATVGVDAAVVAAVRAMLA